MASTDAVAVISDVADAASTSAAATQTLYTPMAEHAQRTAERMQR